MKSGAALKCGAAARAATKRCKKQEINQRSIDSVGENSARQPFATIKQAPFIKKSGISNSNASTKIRLTFFAAAILFLTASAALAQSDSVKKKRLPNPAAVKGFVGGESHNGYVIGDRKNQTLSVQISWTGRGDRRARFVFSQSADFDADDLIAGDRENNDEKNWAGKIPATEDYYIYVTAHPDARYALKVSVK